MSRAISESSLSGLLPRGRWEEDVREPYVEPRLGLAQERHLRRADRLMRNPGASEVVGGRLVRRDDLSM